MSAAVAIDEARQGNDARNASAWRLLLPQIRILLITGPHHTGFRVVREMVAESRSGTSVEIAVDGETAVDWLRESHFDIVLIAHEPPTSDAPRIVAAVRPACSETQPLLVMVEVPDAHLEASSFQHGAEDVIVVEGTSGVGLGWRIWRAWQWQQMARENRRLSDHHRQRRNLDRSELELRLGRQHFKGSHDEVDAADGSEYCNSESAPFPVSQYGDLLRAFVLSGANGLHTELEGIVAELVTSGVAATEILRGHLECLEALTAGSGGRGTRHIASRGDALALEVLRSVCDRYRERLAELSFPNLR